MSPWEKLTPMAMPSGRLCRAMANTKQPDPGAALVAGTAGPRLVVLMGVN